MLKRSVSFLLLFLTSYCLSFALDTLVIKDNEEDYYLTGPYLEILEDKDRSLSIGKISSPAFQNRFVLHTDKDNFPYIKNTGSAYWIKFRIKSQTPSEKRWVLENLDLHIDNLELYKPSADGKNYEMKNAGYAFPFHIREYRHKNFIFDIPVSEEGQTYYVRVTSRNHNPFLLKIRTSNYFTFYALNEYYMLGMFYGIIAIMAIYNLLVYLSIREKVYILYVIYVLICGIISLAEDGTGFQYLWPESPELNRWISILSPILLMLSFTVYSKSFLELKTNLPRINKLLNAMVLTYLAFFILDLSLLNLKWNFPLYIFPFMVIYIASVLCLSKGFRPARYYIVGYSFMFISIIFLIFRMSGIIHWDDIFTVYSFNIGLIFEIVILSFALGDRIRIIKTEKENAQKKIIEQLQENEKLKDKVNRELEAKVVERTQEINEKNEELQYANEQLKLQAEEITRMNLLLDADNRKLQSSVKELVKARVMLKEVDFTEFGKIFPDKSSCMRYLEELKWDKGYKCKKCGNQKFCQGKDVFSRRCTKCRYDESATAYTIFHRLKFPIVKAFYMLFLVYANKGKITSLELSQILNLRQSTCWTFSKKVVGAMKDKNRAAAGDAETDGWSLLVLDPTMKDAMD